MAKATATYLPVEPVKPVIDKVVLELSMEEAKLVRDVLYVTGGDPTTTRRRYASTVLRALEYVVGVRTTARVPDLLESNRTLWFTSPEER